MTTDCCECEFPRSFWYWVIGTYTVKKHPSFIVFQNGEDKYIINELNFDERSSAFSILSVNWSFYQNPRFADPFMIGNKPLVPGPGWNSCVEDYGIKNDDISSLKVSSAPPNH